MKKRICSVVMALVMCLSLLPGTALAADKEGKFAFLVTSDIHGKFFATDYSRPQEESGRGKNGLTRVATYIKEMRKELGEENIFLADAGDTFQGEPLTYYYAFNQPEVEDPAVKAFRNLHYDFYVVGNHEFNYGLKILNRQLDYMTAPAKDKEEPVTVSVANYLDATVNTDPNKVTNWDATWRGYAPYVIRDFNGVKVAVMGLGNPNIPNWDIPENWKGIYFANVIETYKHYEKEMQEKSDLIVVIAHSGLNGDPVKSDFMEQLVKETNSIDAVFSGHEHNEQVVMVKNKDGKSVPVLQPGTKCQSLAQLTVTYDKDTKKVTSVTPEIKNMRHDLKPKKPEWFNEMPVDAELRDILQPYEDAVWKDYMMQPIGKASADFSAANLGLAPSAFMDLVNRVQLWGAYDNTGKNTPNVKGDDKPAQLSISAPLTSGSDANIINKGTIYLGDMFKLYRFENWFYQITMSGEEVHQWLEYSASKIKTDEKGQPRVEGGLTYYDVIYGDGFTYTIDYSKPEGQRVTMEYQGKAVKADDQFTVVLNNYRYNGGGGYVQYLNDHGCKFQPNDPDRVIYSTQFDMIQGEDLGQARSLLTEYIKQEKVIHPTITSTWKVTGGETKPEQPAEKTSFTDVAPDAYYAKAVDWAAQKAITGGTSATTFSPNQSCTRAQMVTFLWRAAGSPAPKAEKNPFTDVKDDAYYAKAVLWAAEEGITGGTSATTFAPNATCTRAQTVTFLYRSAKQPATTATSSFTDVDANAYYASAVNWATENGITGGVTKTTFAPQNNCTRAQIVTFLYRFMVK